MKKGHWLLLFKLVVTVVLLAMLFRKMDIHRLLDVLNNVDPLCFGAAVLLLVPNLLSTFACWSYVITIAGVQLSPKIIFESLLVGYTFAFITPGGVGESGRGVYFKGENVFHMVGLSFVQKFYSLLVTLILGALGLIIYFFDLRALAVALVLLAILAVSCSPRLVGKTLYRLVPYVPFYREEMKVFLEKMKGFYSRKALVLLCLSLCFHAVFFTQFYILLRAFGADLNFFHVVMIVAIIFMLKALVPIAIADLGIREGLSLYFFTQAPFFLKPEIAFNASFLLFVINILIPSITGLFFVHRIEWGKVGSEPEV